MKTKFFALFYGTIITVDVVPEQKVITLTMEVSEVITNIGTGHKHKWKFPGQRRLISCNIECDAAEMELSGMLKAGSKVRVTTKSAENIYVVTAVESEQQTPISLNEFLQNMGKVS